MPKKHVPKQKIKNMVAQDTAFKRFVNNTTVSKDNKDRIRNGLGQAIGFNNFAFNNEIYGTQLSQTDTLWKNNRWYLLSNMRQLLSELYVEHGLVQTMIDIPVDDGLRGGVEISSKQLDEDQIQELQVSLDRDDEINTVGQALKWNRLYGGAGILIMTDQDPETPLDLDAIDKDSPLEFRAVDMWELFWDSQNTEGYDFEIQTQEFEFYSYYAKRIHKSRVMRMKGLTAPSFIRPRLRGWGFSVVEHLVRSINQYLKANNLTFEILDEFKLDIFKIKNLTNLLFSPQGEEMVSKRIRMTNWQKNYQHAMVMDSEDDYVQKQLTTAGIADLFKEFRVQIASEMRIPQIKLWGQGPNGLNASGEDEIEVYNCMVESQVRNKCKYDILRVIEIKCQKLFGFIPDDLSIKFKPMRELGAVDEETVKTSKFNRVLQARQAGEITTFEFRDACNRDKLLGIQLDTADDKLNRDDPEIEAVVFKTGVLPQSDEASENGNPNPRRVDGPDVEDPGANRADTRKTREWDSTTTQPKTPHGRQKVTESAA